MSYWLNPMIGFLAARNTVAYLDSNADAPLKLRTLWLSLGWMLVALVIYLSLRDAPAPLTASVGDKLPHMLAYGALMMWFANLYSSHGVRCAYAGGFVVLGIALEFAQQWTGYRVLEVTDMLANGFGVAAGWWLAPPRFPGFLLVAERLLNRARS